MPDPNGYETGTYWHEGHTACPNDPGSDPAPITVYVPTDKQGWQGVICGGCGQKLQAA